MLRQITNPVALIFPMVGPMMRSMAGWRIVDHRPGVVNVCLSGGVSERASEAVFLLKSRYGDDGRSIEKSCKNNPKDVTNGKSQHNPPVFSKESTGVEHILA